MRIEETLAPVIAEIRTHPHAAAALQLFEEGHRCYVREVRKYGEVQESWDELHVAEVRKPIKDLHLQHQCIPGILRRLLKQDQLPAFVQSAYESNPEQFYVLVMGRLQALSETERLLKQMLV